MGQSMRAREWDSRWDGERDGIVDRRGDRTRDRERKTGVGPTATDGWRRATAKEI